jgi:ribose transport system ATP-binding protein
VTKSFDATVALDDVSFDVAPGEVHALLGANGAGKSTLIKILAGIHQPDGGEVCIDGGSLADVSFIHQDLGLVETMSVAEAVALTRGYPRRFGIVNWAAVREQASRVLAAVGATFPVDSLIGDLSRADRSIVAIGRAITDTCRLLVLDEPTASLSDADVRRVLTLIDGLRRSGVSVLYVTHRLDEVYEIADRLTVLRDGRVITTQRTSDMPIAQLVSLIVGSTLTAQAPRARSLGAGKPVLRAREIALSAARPPLTEFTVGAGEVLGVAGLRGSGQEVLGRGLAGFTNLPMAGLETADGLLRGGAAQRWLRRNVGFASSQREQEGLAMGLSVRENLFINPGARGRPVLAWNSPKREREAASRAGADLQLRPNRPDTVSGALSGGNQQKVILGRWLVTNRPVLVLEEPTMGIDVGARVEIYGLIARLASEGRSIVVVSSDFEELALICHRVLVLDRGALAAELSGDQITVDAMTHYCSGGQGVPA